MLTQFVGMNSDQYLLILNAENFQKFTLPLNSSVKGMLSSIQLTIFRSFLIVLRKALYHVFTAQNLFPQRTTIHI